MPTKTQKLDANLTVNQVVRLIPETVAVFNEFGIDSCCGGGVAIAVAAERDGVDLDTLLQRLNVAAGQS
ncbi:MAG TPA: DUF542 domain-containing protein [Longimicrobiales bacterium]